MKTQKHTKVLPRSAWEGIQIIESNEPLVLVEETQKINVGRIQKEYPQTFYVRKGIADRLIQASEQLPNGYTLVLIEGWRSIESQQKSWDASVQKLKGDQPDWSNEQVEAQVGLVVAKPHPLANHHCGGAVDVALFFEGELVDMGTPYPSIAAGADTREKYPMFPNTLFSKLITKEQEVNRAILRTAMESAGFVWYPGEWWHFCYGDRMWAVYSGKKECMYGPIELR